MTPTDISTAARDIYNASGDTFFTDAQIYNWIWWAQSEMAKEAWLIERTYTTSTVAGLQSYTYPTNCIALKRVTVNGRKIKPITFRMDDAITLSNATITSEGWPSYYTIFNYTIYLRPIPDGVYTMQVFCYTDASEVTAASTLDIPTLFHNDIVNYVLFRMFAKDKDVTNMEIHKSMWDKSVLMAKSYKKRLARADSFATVQSEENLPVTILGEA